LLIHESDDVSVTQKEKRTDQSRMKMLSEYLNDTENNDGWKLNSGVSIKLDVITSSEDNGKRLSSTDETVSNEERDSNFLVPLNVVEGGPVGNKAVPATSNSISKHRESEIQEGDERLEKIDEVLDEDEQQTITIFFLVRIIFGLVTRFGDIGTDIWVLYISYVTEDQKKFFYWLLAFQFLPLPLLLLFRFMSKDTIWTFLGNCFLDATHLSQIRELMRSIKLGSYTDEFFMIHTTEAMLTGFPEAVLQYFVILNLQQEDEEVINWTNETIILLVSTIFSAICVGYSLHGFEMEIYNILDQHKDSCHKFMDTWLLFLYFALDSVVNLLIISLWIYNYTPWGSIFLSWRYFYRSILNFSVYFERGCIYKKTEDEQEDWAPDSYIAMLLFAFFMAGPMQLLTDLPFNHDLAFSGKWGLFALHFGGILDLAAVLVVGNIVNDNVSDILVICAILMQLIKLIIDYYIYIPMLLSDEVPRILQILEHDVSRRLSRLALSSSHSRQKRQRSTSLPVRIDLKTTPRRRRVTAFWTKGADLVISQKCYQFNTVYDAFLVVHKININMRTLSMGWVWPRMCS